MTRDASPAGIELFEQPTAAGDWDALAQTLLGDPLRRACDALERRQHVAGGARFDVVAPHDHAHVLGTGANATAEDAKSAVEAALRAGPDWRALPYDDPVAQAIHELIDHSVENDHRLEHILAELKRLGVKIEEQQGAPFDAEHLNRIVD